MRAAAVVWSLSAASAAYVTTKRTFATTDGAADLAFFVRYFGRPDPSATHDKGCLDRDLGWALPDNFGIHFPQSYVTPESVDGTSLRDWEARKLAAPPLSAFDFLTLCQMVVKYARTLGDLLVNKVRRQARVLHPAAHECLGAHRH